MSQIRDNQIRSYIKRLIELREQAEAINDDCRALYAEIKDDEQGICPKAIKSAVVLIGKDDKAKFKIEDHTARVDEYVAIYEGEKFPAHIKNARAHAPAPARDPAPLPVSGTAATAAPVSHGSAAVAVSNSVPFQGNVAAAVNPPSPLAAAVTTSFEMPDIPACLRRAVA